MLEIKYRSYKLRQTGIYVVKSMINSGPTVTHKFVKI
jgi:hypothetical protein